MTNLSLQESLRRIRLRLFTIEGAAGMVWAFGVAFGLLLVGAWLDLLWELSPAWRLTLLCAAVLAGIASVIILARYIFKITRNRPIARLLDRTSSSGGVILTGVELENSFSIPISRQSDLTVGLARRAVGQAAEVANRIAPANAVPLKRLRRPFATFTFTTGFVGVMLVFAPGLVKTQWNRFLHPFNDVPPYSHITFEVTPGNVDVVYGKELEIRAKVIGASVELAELMIDSGHRMESPLPMFPESDGTWRTVLAKVNDPTEYFVRANRARSEKYHIGVITLPRIKNVRLRITSPTYANRPPYVGQMPKEGVAGLAGTKVQVTIRSNRPLKGGNIEFAGSGKNITIPMKSSVSAGMESAGEFEIITDGKFECRITDTDGQTSEESFSGTVTLLPDERPFIRITQPPKMSLATPNAILPVILSGEDDCGISRLQIFRCLNDSRFLPNDLPQPPQPSRRLDAPLHLPLASYGLQPGDVIKLFGRVEDNDPTGAKGAESPVATVRIISQEQFDKMINQQKGIEALLSKYQSAQRRLENIADEIERLQNKIKTLPPGEEVSRETRDEMQRLQKLLREQSEALTQASKQKLSFDADNILAPHLDKMIELTKDMAKELEKLEAVKQMKNEKLSGKLAELVETLSSRRKSYNQQVTMPLEQLEAVFRLLVDEQRFIALAQWQRDLADRLSSLKGRDGEDNPALKARCREMEETQREIREALATLLIDIDDHIERLPNEPDLDRLRRTAADFVKEVRASGAAEAMSEAESSLAEFATTRGHEKAKAAADILEQFIKKCDGNCNLPNDCQGHIFFQPSLGDGMGNTMGQLLGMGMGNGFGMNGLSAMGIYGGMPIVGGMEGWMGNDQQSIMSQSRRTSGTVPKSNPDARTSNENPGIGNASGANEGEIPVQYRREVGKYFQRVAEESGDVNP